MPQNIALRIYAIAILLTVLTGTGFYYISQQYDGTAWNGIKVSPRAIKGEYCEHNNMPAFIHQRMNTYSNLAYFFLGMIVVQVALYDWRNRSSSNFLQQFPLLSGFFGLCLIYLCFGSAFFHASLTWPGQRVDMNGTYSVCLSLTTISFLRLRNKTFSSKAKFLLVAGLLAVVLLFVQVHLMISSLFLLPFFIVLVTTCTAVTYSRNKNRFALHLAVISFVILIAAFIVRTLDVAKIGCNPYSIYQGHSLWHIFTGMSAFLMFWFYRTEKEAAN